MNAQQTRQQHITKIEAEINRLSAAIVALKKDTQAVPADDWSWAGDLGELAQKLNEITDKAEACVRVGSEERLVAAAATLGRKGGTSTSDAKRASSAENGKKGGRPKKRAS